MNLNKIKYSVQQQVSQIPTSRDDSCDPPEIQRHVEQLELMRIKMKNIREGTVKQSAYLNQEAQTKKLNAKGMDSAETGYDKGPSNQILQRISEFNTLTSGNSMMLAEVLQSSVADPCYAFIKEDMAEAKKKKDVYDKAKSDYKLAQERNRNAEVALKKASQKDKMFFQEKFRESGQTLDEAQDRYEILTRELESTLSIVCETSSTVIVKSLIAYLEAFHEFHDTCSVWLKNLMETDSIKNWRKYVEEKEEELAKKRAAGCGPSKKVYGNKISELSRFDQEVNPDALPVPTPILRLIEFLNDHCLSVEGIFRLSGNQNEVDIERRKIDAWEPVEYSSVKDAHLVSGLLKKYLRDLPEPLLTYELFGAFLATKDLPENQAVESLNKTMKKLPEVNRATFHAICQLCYNVQRFSDKNKMTPMNLGIVFAPSCLYGKADNPAALELSLDANSVVAFIIEHCDEVFKGEVCAIPKVTGGANAPKTAAKPSTGAKSPFPSTKSPIPATKSPEHTAPAPPPARASEWTEHTTEEGISYWFNAVTGVSTWTDPNPKKQTQKPTPSPLPSATPPNPAPLPFPDGGGGTGGRRVIDASTAGGGRAGMRGSVQVKAAPLPQSSQNAVSPGGGNLLNLGSPSRPNQRGGAAMAGKKRSATVGGGPPPMSSAGRGGGPPRVLPNPGGAPGGGNSAPRTLPNPGGAPPGVGVPPRSSKPNIQQPNYGSTFPGPSKGGTAGAGGGPPGRSLPNPGGGPPPGGMQGAGSRPAGGRPLPPPK